MIKLGVNIDHVATLRQARGTQYPSPVQAALMAEGAGADSITLHLREDRRHIQDADVYILRHILQTKMNLEMAVTDEMLGIATRLKPADCCLVPENRAEVTTEGGLDVARDPARLRDAIAALRAAGIRVSLFIDPEPRQVDAARAAGAPVIELHTGEYAQASGETQERELARLSAMASLAAREGIEPHAGHGLTYDNVTPVAAIPQLAELNFGHFLIGEAIFGDRSIARWIVAAIVGVLIYRLLVALALRVGMQPVDLKLVTAALLLAALAVPRLRMRMLGR